MEVTPPAEASATAYAPRNVSIPLALIAYSFASETLQPGDLLGSGACGTGCGLELGRWIQPGDVIELSIDGIGTLRNRVVRHAADRRTQA